MLNLFKSEKKTAQVRILIVDDEPDLVSTIQCRLQARQFEVLTASNGEEGLTKAVAEKPDIILLDSNMPVMTGPEMLERLRSQPGFKDVPVIMLTALCEAQDIESVSSLGIADYVTKPFDFPELLEKISAALDGKNPK